MQTAHLWATSRNLPFAANLDIIENSPAAISGATRRHAVQLLLGIFVKCQPQPSIGGIIFSARYQLKRRQLIRGDDLYGQLVRRSLPTVET